MLVLVVVAAELKRTIVVEVRKQVVVRNNAACHNSLDIGLTWSSKITSCQLKYRVRVSILYVSYNFRPLVPLEISRPIAASEAWIPCTSRWDFLEVFCSRDILTDVFCAIEFVSMLA